MALVTVNRVVIPDEEIHYESARVDERGVDERRGAAARQLVVRELLRQRADEAGFDTGDDADAAVEALLEREIPKPEIDDVACQRYFEANPERFCTPVMAEVRHILLAAPPDDVNARAEAEQRAEALIEEADNGNESVSALAARHSDCPSATDGGHLGAVGRGQTVPEFEDVVLRLEPGVARRPVETRYGFHVVEVIAREGGEPLSYDQVSHLIADYIRERSWRRAVSQYIGQLAADAEIEGVELDVPDSPLVQ